MLIPILVGFVVGCLITYIVLESLEHRSGEEVRQLRAGLTDIADGLWNARHGTKGVTSIEFARSVLRDISDKEGS